MVGNSNFGEGSQCYNALLYDLRVRLLVSRFFFPSFFWNRFIILSRHKEQSSSGEGEFFRFVIGVRHQIFFKSWPRFWSTNAIFNTKDQEQTTNNARCSLIIVFITSAKYFLELFIRRSVPPPLPWNIVRRVRLHGRSVYFTFNLSLPSLTPL